MSDYSDFVPIFIWLIILAMIYMIRLAVQRGKRNAGNKGEGRDRDSSAASAPSGELPPLRWLDVFESPTGRPVLDCRCYALGFQFETSDEEAKATFARMCTSDGSELDGMSPAESWIVATEWDFEFEEIDGLTSGFRSESTEDLWSIDYRNSRLYFRRSWTGQLVYMTNFRHVPTAGASITRIWVTGDEPFGQQSPEYIAAYVRHLIDTHLLGVLTPFPIPPEFPHDDRKIASLVFHSVGRRGWLAEYFHTPKNA